MTLNELVKRAHQNSVDHGFWDDQTYMAELEGLERKIVARFLAEQTIPEKLCLIHSEVSEALECYRDDSMVTGPDDNQTMSHMRKHDLSLSAIDGETFVCPACHDLLKPVGFPSELADILIRVFDLAGALGIDLEAEVELKMNYNKSRPYKHGKVC